MNQTEVRHPLLNIRSAEQEVKVDILRSGLVRLSVQGDTSGELITETLEDLLLEAAASPLLSAEIYDQLHWELDMMARYGDQ